MMKVFSQLFVLLILSGQALSGERACYNTVQSFGNQMLMLGTRSFHVISIRTWIERINHFVDQVNVENHLFLNIFEKIGFVFKVYFVCREQYNFSNAAEFNSCNFRFSLGG